MIEFAVDAPIVSLLACVYAAAITVLATYGLNLLWMSIRKALTIKEERAFRPCLLQDADLPTVTVQLPLYNERYLVERLIDAAAALAYPREKLEIQILDDSTDDTSELAAARGAYWRSRGTNVRHLPRPTRSGYKAGALQEGLRSAAGEFVAIFDADFLPPPDFLLRLLPLFDAERIGMVQARWEHLGLEGSWLKRVQAYGLDTHFELEQWVRSRCGLFMNFNGTAGIWRREAIVDAGGWSSGTLAEDVDLSYRAQLRGWTFRYAPDVQVPAELPADMNAVRIQQFRWKKGTAEVAVGVLGRLLTSGESVHRKLQGTLHLSSGLIFPALLAVTLLHAPVMLSGLGSGVDPLRYAWAGLGLMGLAGFVTGRLSARRTRHARLEGRDSRSASRPGRAGRALILPLFLVATMGIALSNSIAVLEGLFGRRTPFVRTPKYPSEGLRKESDYRVAAFPTIGWFEVVLFLYSLGALVALARAELWSAIPFQVAFAAGFGLITLANFDVASRRREGLFALDDISAAAAPDSCA